MIILQAWLAKKSEKIILILLIIGIIQFSNYSVYSAPVPAGNNYISSDRIANVAAAMFPSVVSIQTESEEIVEFDFPFDEDFFEKFFGITPPSENGNENKNEKPKKRTVIGDASGTIITSDGYILTNFHVVEDAQKITVILGEDKEYSARVVGKDRFSDLAVIKIDAQGLCPAKLGNSSIVRPGDWVLAVGSPLGYGPTVTFGIVSAVSREIPISSIEFIQTDAAINPGNSGGPLVNINGEVIGLNTAIAGRAQGIGFSIPINIAREISGQLIAGKVIPRPWVGIAMAKLNPDIARELGIEPNIQGVVISEVFPNSPASQAGLKQGDIVEEIDGRKIRDPKEFQAIVRSKQIGSTINIKILRDGKTISKDITVTQWPEEDVFEELE